MRQPDKRLWQTLRRHRHADRPVPQPRRSRARGARERSALPRADPPFVRLVLGARHGRTASRGSRGRNVAGGDPGLQRRLIGQRALGHRPRGRRAAGTRTARCSKRASRSTTADVAPHGRRHGALHARERRAAVQSRRQLRRLPRRRPRRHRREARRADAAPRARGGAPARRRRGRGRRTEGRDPRGVRRRGLRLRPLLPRRRRVAALPGRLGDRRAGDRALHRALAQLRVPRGRRPDRHGVAHGRGGLVGRHHARPARARPQRMAGHRPARRLRLPGGRRGPHRSACSTSPA